MSTSARSSPIPSTYLSSNDPSMWASEDHSTMTAFPNSLFTSQSQDDYELSSGRESGMENQFLPQLDEYSWTSASDTANTPISNSIDSTRLSSINLPSWASPNFSAKQVHHQSPKVNNELPFASKSDSDVEVDDDDESSNESSSSGSSSRGNDVAKNGPKKRSSHSEEGENVKKRQTKGKVQRRQGVTCDQCRSKHIRCIAASSVSPTPGDTNVVVNGERKKCARCIAKGLECTRNHAPPSRRYPRPSRTGKRIEQARMIHGSVQDTTLRAFTGKLEGQAGLLVDILGQQSLPLSVPHESNHRLQQYVIAGSTSLRLLTCFFATAHIQLPIVDFHNFSARYTFAQGNCRVMSVMATGGDELQRIPSARQSAPGLRMTRWPLENGTSTLATPGTTETLIAAMHAWAAIYTDLPIAFGTNAGLLELHRMQSDESETLFDDSGIQSNVSNSGNPSGASTSPNQSTTIRRPKRKQGVACDTCRLRRLRCDKLERPEGMGCTRCEDKRIVCTDEYIQAKRAKSFAAAAAAAAKKKSLGLPMGGTFDNINPELSNVEEKQNKTEGTYVPLEENDVISSAKKLHAQDLPSGTGPNSWDGSSKEQTAWIDKGPNLPKKYTFGQGYEMIAYGKARQPFVHALIERAINLAYQHNLLQMPSIEAIQALLIISQVLSLLRRQETAVEFAEAVGSHTNLLGLESNDEVDEQDKVAVELILSQLQRKRLWCCVWGRDALNSGLFRSVPAFEAERAVGIKGTQTQNVQGANTKKSDMSAMTAGSEDNAHGLQAQTVYGRLELNGQMGLSFSILALLQVGALARFMNKHIDNVTQTRPALYLGPGSGSKARQASEDRFPMMPTQVEMRRLQRACTALWRSIDSLLLFFDECALKAREDMASLKPFQPLVWIATLKISAAVLDLCTYRILGERIQLARTYIQATFSLSTQSDGNNLGGVNGMQEFMGHQLNQLENLQAASQQRCWTSCRRIVVMVEFLLAKNVFQTSGLLLHNLTHIANFLVLQPAIPAAILTRLPDENPIVHQTQSDDHHQQQNRSIDPRSLLGGDMSTSSSTSTSSSRLPKMNKNEMKNPKMDRDHIPEHVLIGQLANFDTSRKYHEIQVCLEAMAQMGYSWPSIDQEISQIQQGLHFSSFNL